jgi:hypothetical protein
MTKQYAVVRCWLIASVADFDDFWQDTVFLNRLDLELQTCVQDSFA